MDEEFRPVVRKQRQKQADTQASDVLNTLYAEGLRHIELDEDCRAYLSSSSASVQAKALTQLLRKRREAKVNNPSAFLTQAIKAAELVNSSGKIPTNKVNNASVNGTSSRPSLCQSANQLLGWLHKEGLKPAQLDEASLLYLGRCSPATQTKALTNLLQQWRGPNPILNPSAYLTKLLANAYQEAQYEHPGQDTSHATPSPKAGVKAATAFAVPVVPYTPSDFLPYKQAEYTSNVAAVDNVTAALADLSPISREHSIGTDVWPAVTEASVPSKQNVVVTAKPCSLVENAVMRCFANQFVVMNAEDLNGLQLQDLEIVLKVNGESGISDALEKATEAAQMALLYDMLDDAGQREILLRELEYAAEVAVDKLASDGQI